MSLESTERTVDQAIDQAIEGNQIAFSYLLDKYWPLVYGFQLKRTQNEADAEDITIQTFSRAFANISSYKKSYEFGTWLVAISKNIHIDLLRKQRSNILSQATNRMSADSDADRVLDETPSAEDKLISEQNLATLLKHLKSLKPSYKQVLQMRYFSELGYAEMARKLNEPIGTVKVKVLRARRLLAEKIREGSG